MTQGVLFGAGIVLTWPALTAGSGFWISAVIAASFVLAAPIAWLALDGGLTRRGFVLTPVPPIR